MDMEEFLKKYYFMYKYHKQKNNLIAIAFV